MRPGWASSPPRARNRALKRVRFTGLLLSEFAEERRTAASGAERNEASAEQEESRRLRRRILEEREVRTESEVPPAAVFE